MQISSNTIVYNEIKNVDGLVQNLIAADIDEILFLDGGSDDGTYERLIEHARNNQRIQVLRWPQPPTSQYRRDWREADRRNLLMNISKGDYILYIDADERITPRLKENIIGHWFYCIPMLHWWGTHIRVDTNDDRRWNTDHLRIFKKLPFLSWQSVDKNGLHNHLTLLGIGVNVCNRGASPSMKRRVKQLFLNRFSQKCSDITIYHLHYVDLERRKPNDLRTWDLDNCDIVVVPDNVSGLQYDKKQQKIVCVRIPTADEVTMQERFGESESTFA
ncbi:MAG: glycosyltransferase [Caldilineaceae bacterium]|nr:glycosyltransferase [Caldilineaceae bacterium]